MVAEASKLLVLNKKSEIREKIGTGYLIRHDFQNYEYSNGPVLRNSRCCEPFCRTTYDSDKYKKLWQNFHKKKLKK